MSTVLEALRNASLREAEKTKKRKKINVFAAFYNTRSWRAARYAFIKTQPRPLRCKACGATAQDSRICVDHVIAVKKEWARRLDPTNFQLLCDDCNLAKGSQDATDFRDPFPLADSAAGGFVGEKVFQSDRGN